MRARNLAPKPGDSNSSDQVASALGGIAAQLWVWDDRTKALEWVEAWGTDPALHRDSLISFISTLRAALFARYQSGDARKPEISDRAQHAATIILIACSTAAAVSHASATGGKLEGSTLDVVVTTYRSAESIIGHLANQLYFGSGAHRNGNQDAVVGLTNLDAMRQFLVDYRQILSLLGASHEPSTHHHLIELYEYLIPGDPTAVFDALHALLLGAGAREGYHHEGLASTVIARMVTRYVADHRSIFEDDERRGRLVEILKLFSDVGWPEALKLLYDLPELLR